QKTNAVGFPKAGELIEITGAHELEAQDRAVLNLLYQHAHDSGRLVQDGAEWELSMAALRPSRHESNDRLRDSLDRLMRVVVTVPFPSAETGEPRFLKTHLFDFFDLSANERAASATVRFGLPKKLQPVLLRSSRWGRIKAETVCAMASKYAIALYELVQLRSGLDRCVETFPIERFRDLLGVPPGKLLRGPDFERRVVEPAVLEVNALSDLGVQAKLVRAHARAPITAVTLAWWRKEGNAFRAVCAEQQQPKQGRMARLRRMAAAEPNSAGPSGKTRRNRRAKVDQAATPVRQLDLVEALAVLPPGAAE
ncbi:MAG: replication initiation protein, partial [Bryobacterales bacterium]|nr:replication initiation protein [Bryobacterales bacterium]